MSSACLDALEAETRSSVVARRNFLFGLWAGQRLGLADDALALYAQAVMAADLEESGPFDMLDKVASDFRAMGEAGADEAALLGRLQQVERHVRRELLVTD